MKRAILHLYGLWIGIVGKDSTFCFPSSDVDELLKVTGGDPRKIEKILSLEDGSLGDSIVRIDVPEPQGSRMPSGNEKGANDHWIPGGYTDGGMKEVVIDPVSRGEYIVIEVKVGGA